MLPKSLSWLKLTFWVLRDEREGPDHQPWHCYFACCWAELASPGGGDQTLRSRGCGL